MVGFIRSMDDDYVEAIEGGKIVKVEASYARREGLPILRFVLPNIGKGIEKRDSQNEDSPFFQANDLKTMLSHKQKNPIDKALIPNFHWYIVQARRKKNITRKQLAKFVGLSSREIQMLENGIFPTQDLVVLARLEEVLGISIRKGVEEFGQPMRRMVENKIRIIDDVKELDRKPYLSRCGSSLSIQKSQNKTQGLFDKDNFTGNKISFIRSKKEKIDKDADDFIDSSLEEDDFTGEEIELEESKDL